MGTFKQYSTHDLQQSAVFKELSVDTNNPKQFISSLTDDSSRDGGRFNGLHWGLVFLKLKLEKKNGIT